VVAMAMVWPVGVYVMRYMVEPPIVGLRA